MTGPSPAPTWQSLAHPPVRLPSLRVQPLPRVFSHSTTNTWRRAYVTHRPPHFTAHGLRALSVRTAHYRKQPIFNLSSTHTACSKSKALRRNKLTRIINFKRKRTFLRLLAGIPDIYASLKGPWGVMERCFSMSPAIVSTHSGGISFFQSWFALTSVMSQYQARAFPCNRHWTKVYAPLESNQVTLNIFGRRRSNQRMPEHASTIACLGTRHAMAIWRWFSSLNANFFVPHFMGIRFHRKSFKFQRERTVLPMTL